MILVAHGLGAELRQPAEIDLVIQDTAYRSVIPQMTAVANWIRLADQAVIVVGRNGNVIRIQDICDRPDIVSRRPQLKDTAYNGGTCRLDHGRVLAARSLLSASHKVTPYVTHRTYQYSLINKLLFCIANSGNLLFLNFGERDIF